MDPLDTQLIIFSWLFCATVAIAILVPILFFHRDWVTAWNIFLVGSFIFTGLSGINATRMNYGIFSSSTYMRYFTGVMVFYGTIFCVYHFFKWPRRFAGRHFLKWPDVSSSSLFTLVICLMAFSMFRVFVPNIPFVRQVLAQFSIQAAVIAATLAFAAWYRNRDNAVLLALLVVTLMWAVFFGIMAGGGRRYLINALLVPVVCYYWMALRYRPDSTVIAAIFGLAVAIAPVYVGYNSLRHFHARAADGTESSVVKRAVEIMRMLPSTFTKDVQFSEDTIGSFMGQDSVECALVTIEYLYDGSGRLEFNPLYTLYVIAVNPIPRSMWLEKPESLGKFLPKKMGIHGLGVANRGVNVVGQSFYDGGYVVLVLYALLFGSFLRIVDELLTRQPDNPYLLAFLTCSAGQLLGWSRGQVDMMSIQIISPLLFTIVIAYAGRIAFGTGLAAPRTDNIVNFPNRFELGRLRQMGMAY